MKVARTSQGLSPEDHGYLNGLSPMSVTLKKRRWIYKTKRREYASDPKALQQIDIYDGESTYGKKWRQYRDALIANNHPTLIAELEAWFETNYPATRH